MLLKFKWQLSNDLLLVHTLLLIAVGVRIVIFHWLQRGHVSQAHAPLRALWPRGCGCAQGPVPTAENSSASIQPRSRERGAHTEKKMDGVGSFGAGRTGSTVDPIAFVKQPQTILRVLSWVSVVFVFFLNPCAAGCNWCVSVRERGWREGGVFSVVAAWVPWRSLSPQIWITETLRYLMCRLCKFACDAVRLHVNMLEGGTTKGPAVIWKPWLWNWSYYRSI